MIIDGRIEVLETEALQAFIYLTLETLGEEEVGLDLTARLIEVASGIERYEGASLSHGDAERFLALMRRASQELRRMSPDRQTTVWGLTPTRFKLFDTVTQDVERAVRDQKKLVISTGAETVSEMPDLRSLPTLRSMLAAHGLLTGAASVNDLFDDPVIAFGDRENADSLLVVYDDIGHTSFTVQKRIRSGVLRLHRLGVEIHGTEGSAAEVDYPTKYAEDPGAEQVVIAGGAMLPGLAIVRCVTNGEDYLESEFDRPGKAVNATIAVECLLGSDILSFGVECEGTLGELVRMASLGMNPAYLAQYKAALELYELQIVRGYDAIDNMVGAMDENRFPIGALTFGAAHFFEIKEALDSLDVDYVMIRPAAL